MFDLCEHMDIVKKLKGQNDPYKDAFARVFRGYQPIPDDEDWDTHIRVLKPFKHPVRDEAVDDMVYRLL